MGLLPSLTYSTPFSALGRGNVVPFPPAPRRRGRGTRFPRGGGQDVPLRRSARRENGEATEFALIRSSSRCLGRIQKLTKATTQWPAKRPGPSMANVLQWRRLADSPSPRRRFVNAVREGASTPTFPSRSRQWPSEDLGFSEGRRASWMNLDKPVGQVPPLFCPLISAGHAVAPTGFDPRIRQTA